MTTLNEKFKFPSLKGKLVWPLSKMWESTSRLRRVFYRYGFLKVERFRVPIISIGNLSFGGTGKTPLTLWLMEFLQEQKIKPLILMRGYRGDFEHSAGIIFGGRTLNFPTEYFGDEAILLGRRLKQGAVVVGKRRSENLKFYFPQVEPHVVLLEDGYQHLRIARDLNMVIFDATVPLGQYRVAPGGILREGTSALKDADVILLSKSDQVTHKQLEDLQTFLKNFIPVGKNVLQAMIKHTPRGLYNAHDRMIYRPDEFKGRRVLVLAAIAVPQSFFQTLESLGAIIVYKMTFKDHYYFSDEDLSKALKKAEELNLDIITTEKDMVKIRRVALDDRILYLGIKIEFLKGEELLKKKILEVISLKGQS